MLLYNKPALTSDKHIELLSSRGLIINDKERTKRYLETIGYFRLSAYYHPFYEEHEKFKKGTKFEDLLVLYIFDRKLRLLTLDAIQRIEIAIRTRISDLLSIKYCPLWYNQSDLFLHYVFYDKLIKRINKSCNNNQNQKFIIHFKDKYKCSKLPPSWMIAELLPMGSWSKIFSELACKQDKRAISNAFGFKPNNF